MGVGGKHHALATILPGKEAHAPTAKEDGWTPELLWILWSREIPLALLAIEPRSLSSTARSHYIRQQYPCP